MVTLPPVRCILNRITNQIDQHLLDPVPITSDLDLIDFANLQVQLFSGQSAHLLENFQ